MKARASAAELLERGLPSERPEGTCWEWTRGRYPAGYGQVSGYGGAHRVAWETFIGPIPPGLLVLHRCDNPPCCNPAHLWLGTHKDNMDDRNQKQRYGYGKNSPRSNGVVVISGKGYIRRALMMPSQSWVDLKIAAARRGLTMGQWVERALTALEK